MPKSEINNYNYYGLYLRFQHIMLDFLLEGHIYMRRPISIILKIVLWVSACIKVASTEHVATLWPYYIGPFHSFAVLYVEKLAFRCKVSWQYIEYRVV